MAAVEFDCGQNVKLCSDLSSSAYACIFCSETKKRPLSLDRFQSTDLDPDAGQHELGASAEERAFKSRSLLEVKEQCLATVASHSSSHPNLIMTDSAAVAADPAPISEQKTTDAAAAAAAAASESKDISVLITN